MLRFRLTGESGDIRRFLESSRAEWCVSRARTELTLQENMQNKHKHPNSDSLLAKNDPMYNDLNKTTINKCHLEDKVLFFLI